MRCRVLPTVLLASMMTFPLDFAHAEPALPQRYLEIFLKINDAEQLERQGDYRGALEKFNACYAGLAAIRGDSPNWETALVYKRMEDCQAKIRQLQTEAAAQPDAATGSAGVASGTGALISSPVPAVSEDLPIARNSTTNASDSPAPTASYRTSLDSPADTTKTTHTYPWKTNIITTEFWIGEGSHTASAWDKNWVSSNNGPDTPANRQEYLPAGHVPTLNPFYVALPFNDLAHPDAARRWLPEGWAGPAGDDGKPVSACKDRWVEVKTSVGAICYAQWEDVGPGGDDHADYVFGDKRPGLLPTAGLAVSPAVSRYLGLAVEGKNQLTSWRFVDAENVPPGYWLKYDEEALIYSALHQQLKVSGAPSEPERKSTATAPTNSPAGHVAPTPVPEGDLP